MKTTVLLTIAAVAAALLPGRLLELQRGGELWRIATCQFTHWSYEQLAWDGLSFLALGIACARRDRRSFHATLFASLVGVPLAVLAFAPHVSAYRGLSGIDSALFALLLATESRRCSLATLFAAGFLAKIVFEALTGATVFVQELGPGVVAVPVAHIAGAAIGVTVWWIRNAAMKELLGYSLAFGGAATAARTHQSVPDHQVMIISDACD